MGSSTSETTGGQTSDGIIASDSAAGDDTGSETSSGTSLTSDSGSSSSFGTSTDGSSSGSDTGDVPVLQCEGQADLQACYDFVGVGSGMLWDRSGNGNDAVAAGVGVVPGPFGDAATFDTDSEIAVPDSASLDIPGPITIEAWIRVDALPHAARVGVLDNEGQYDLTIYPSDEYRCNTAPGQLFAGPVVVGEWSHVACVYDGFALRAYVNGVEIGSTGASGPLLTADTEPMSIGDTSPTFDEPFDGAIGGIRVWSRALGSGELCEAAEPLCGG